MIQSIKTSEVSCTSDRVFVGGAEKTCKNYRSSDKKIHILCNSQRFLQTSESDQYVLVHHEYAGVSGFETNLQEESTYTISNQISQFLVEKKVKKLAILPRRPPSGTRLSPEEAFLTALRLSEIFSKASWLGECSAPEAVNMFYLLNLVKDSSTEFRGFHKEDLTSAYALSDRIVFEGQGLDDKKGNFTRMTVFLRGPTELSSIEVRKFKKAVISLGTILSPEWESRQVEDKDHSFACVVK